MEDEDGTLWEALHQAHSSVINEFKRKFQPANTTASLLDDLKAFAHAVDWTERWILGLLAAQAALLLAVIVFRRSMRFQAVAFFAAMAVAFNAERLNALAAAHWRSFSRQNYFDARGTFAAALLLAPLLATMFAALANHVAAMAGLLVEAKARQMRHAARAAARARRDAGGAVPEAAAGGGRRAGRRRRAAAAEPRG